MQILQSIQLLFDNVFVKQRLLASTHQSSTSSNTSVYFTLYVRLSNQTRYAQLDLRLAIDGHRKDLTHWTDSMLEMAEQMYRRPVTRMSTSAINLKRCFSDISSCKTRQVTRINVILSRTNRTEWMDRGTWRERETRRALNLSFCLSA